MDLWVAAAAAAAGGAGYLAKYWNRLSTNSDRSPHLSSEDSGFENGESPSRSFGGQAQRDRFEKDVVSAERRASDVDLHDGLLTVNLASNRGLDTEKLGRLRNYNEGDVLSESELSGTFVANEKHNGIEDGNEQSSSIGGNCGFLLPDSSAGEVGYILNPAGNKTCLRTKHMYGHITRPLNSLESCLVAQLYKEHAKIEEHSLSSLSSASRATRSFLLCDGSRRISRANDDDSSCALIGTKEYKLRRDTSQVTDEHVLFGVPALRKIGSSNDVKKMRLNAENEQSGRLSSSNGALSGQHVYAQYDATFLFSLGISCGIITTILANKREMDELRELLKQNENLVQDLQEELDMKDSVTVKELHSENYGSQDTCNHSFCDKELSGFSPEKHMDNSPIVDCRQSYEQKEEENSESMNKIEAELEAELERLGLNMNESSLDRRLSELVELDPDFEADFAQGELRADMVSAEDFGDPKSDKDASEPMTAPVNYAVSPHELSLCLHEVIQSRLEDRVQELELALQNSQRKLRALESGHAGCSQKYFPSCGQASSFTNGTILTYDDCDPIAEPQVMNLSGEGLGAYNEAYDESIKLDDSEENSPLSSHDTDHKGASSFTNGTILTFDDCDPIAEPQVMNLSGEGLGAYNQAYDESIKLDDLEENSPLSNHDTDHKGGLRSHDWHVSRDQDCGANGPIAYSIVSEERLSRELSSSEVAMLEVQGSSVHGLNDPSGDEDCDSDSEMERQLIRQIVERTRKGSPVFQNARRVLYSMDDDDEH